MEGWAATCLNATATRWALVVCFCSLCCSFVLQLHAFLKNWNLFSSLNYHPLAPQIVIACFAESIVRMPETTLPPVTACQRRPCHHCYWQNNLANTLENRALPLPQISMLEQAYEILSSQEPRRDTKSTLKLREGGDPSCAYQVLVRLFRQPTHFCFCLCLLLLLAQGYGSIFTLQGYDLGAILDIGSAHSNEQNEFCRRSLRMWSLTTFFGNLVNMLAVYECKVCDRKYDWSHGLIVLLYNQ